VLPKIGLHERLGADCPVSDELIAAVPTLAKIARVGQPLVGSDGDAMTLDVQAL